MKSGDPCAFSGGCCGSSDTSAAEIEPSVREVCCSNGVLSATDTARIETAPPREGVSWKDCSALADGRNGERCEGIFACFREAKDHCVERVACGESTFGADKLLRYLVCDDVGSPPPAAATGAEHTNCENALNADPLDRCSGEFMCELAQRTTSERVLIGEIPPCEGREGYCPAKWEYPWNSILRCSAGAIHIYSFGMRV